MEDDRVRVPIGDILDARGVVAGMDDGDLVAGAIVLLKVVDEDGDVILRTAWSEGMSWIERLGMLHAAEVADAAFVEDA